MLLQLEEADGHVEVGLRADLFADAQLRLVQVVVPLRQIFPCVRYHHPLGHVVKVLKTVHLMRIVARISRIIRGTASLRLLLVLLYLLFTLAHRKLGQIRRIDRATITIHHDRVGGDCALILFPFEVHVALFF